MENISQHEMRVGANTLLVIAAVDTINGCISQRPLRALVDTGLKRSFTYKSALPKLCRPNKTDRDYSTALLDRTTITNRQVVLNDIVLLEFNSSRKITQPCTMLVAETNAGSFNVVLGQDVNVTLGIDVINTRKVCSWMRDEVPF